MFFNESFEFLDADLFIEILIDFEEIVLDFLLGLIDAEMPQQILHFSNFDEPTFVLVALVKESLDLVFDFLGEINLIDLDILVEVETEFEGHWGNQSLPGFQVLEHLLVHLFRNWRVYWLAFL